MTSRIWPGVRFSSFPKIPTSIPARLARAAVGNSFTGVAPRCPVRQRPVYTLDCPPRRFSENCGILSSRCFRAQKARWQRAFSASAATVMAEREIAGEAAQQAEMLRITASDWSLTMNTGSSFLECVHITVHYSSCCARSDLDVRSRLLRPEQVLVGNVS